jgi:transcription elongation factor Elf1
MKLTKRTSQTRRDFRADYQCEFCGHKENNQSGYDDSYYYTHVIPNMMCSNCRKSTISGHGTPQHITPVAPEGIEI